MFFTGLIDLNLLLLLDHMTIFIRQVKSANLTWQWILTVLQYVWCLSFIYLRINWVWYWPYNLGFHNTISSIGEWGLTIIITTSWILEKNELSPTPNFAENSINLSPLKRTVNSLNEIEQISGQFMIYRPVLAIKYGDLIAWGSLEFRYSKGFLKYLKIYVDIMIFTWLLSRSRVIARPLIWFNLSRRTGC